MTQEKTGLDCVCCPISDCKKIFTRRELVQLGNLLVIPEHRNPSTEAVCRGCFKEPNEIENSRVSNFLNNPNKF